MGEKCELEHFAQAICSINGYTYIRYLDAGAFKETYEISLKSTCYALKVFKANNSSERTEREIDAMQRVRCENVSQLYKVDYINIDGILYLYLVEEFLAGGSLRTLINVSALSRDEVISIGRDLLNALSTTYLQHIVHRDIKPDNVMFRKERAEAVLIDFGLVRNLDASSLTQAFFERGPGTALYSAPEQLNNNKALIDWRTDQFALGITLYEALFGEHPFASSSPVKTVEKVAALDHCNPLAVENIIEVGLDPLVKMLEPYPINRYRTPSILINEWNKAGGI